LKLIFRLFLYLNIYTYLILGANSQELTLKYTTSTETEKQLLDSIGMQSKFKSVNLINEYLNSTITSLVKFGFFDANFTPPTRINDSTFNTNFSTSNLIKNITIHYTNPKLKPVLENLNINYNDNKFNLATTNIETVLQQITNNIANQGNPFARVKLTNIKQDSNTSLSATIIITAGEKRKIDSITVKGYEKFPKSFIKYYAGIKKGKDINIDKLKEKNNKLHQLGFASSPKPPELLFKKDSTIVYLYLKKENNNLFDGILGFATNAETQKLELNGYLNLELNNNLNFGEQLIINYKADGNEQQNFRAKVKLPYLFKSPVGVSGELKIFKKDSTFLTTDQHIKLLYQSSTNSLISLGYKSYESSNLLDEQNSNTTILDYNSKFATIGFEVIKLQSNPLFQTKYFFQIKNEIGNRTIENNKEEQYKGSLTAFYNFNLNQQNSIFTQNTTSLLTNNTYITNDLFRFGGINSIRGFNENSIDASFFSVLNIEYRYIFNPTLYIHSITDFAYFENKVIDLKEKLYGFGLGFGLLTKAGILKLNLANGFSENQKIDFSNTKIHISLTSRF